MRQQIDCAVLVLAAHQRWMPEVLKIAEPAFSRIRIHALEWEAGHHLETEPDEPVSLPIETIAQSAVGLRRYDIVLMSVSMETLTWTRQALGAIPRGPFIPMVGIFKDLRSAAIQDLLELGMRDFVRIPICPEELRARVLSTVANVPRPGSLREPEPGYGQASWLTGLDQHVMHPARPAHPLRTSDFSNAKSRIVTPRKTRLSKYRRTISQESLDEVLKNSFQVTSGISKSTETSSSEPMSFKAAKAALVEDFERRYITEALVRNEGNIAMAARYSEKHRRAFWALMRKYSIDAEGFRPHVPEG